MNENLWPYTHQERHKRLVESARRERLARTLCELSDAADPQSPSRFAGLRAWVTRLFTRKRVRVALHR